MSHGTNLYRFRLNISDIDRAVYDTIDFRMAQHPSESIPFLLTRMLAYTLNFTDGLAFSTKGLSEPEEPCISSDAARGGKELWIEVGNPSARRLHKAAKAANHVKVYTYKNVDALLRELQSEDVHNGDKIEIYSFAEDFLTSLEAILDRDNQWEFYRDQQSIMISVGDESVGGDLQGPVFIPGARKR
jgi:uncharacterized protein YaeQ